MQTESPAVPAFFAFILGIVVGGSAILAAVSEFRHWPLSLYLAFLAAFHFFEYFLQVKYHPETTTSEGNCD